MLVEKKSKQSDLNNTPKPMSLPINDLPLSEDGCYCVGKWTNGLMEDIFDLTETDGWKRARYQRFVTSTRIFLFKKKLCEFLTA